MEQPDYAYLAHQLRTLPYGSPELLDVVETLLDLGPAGEAIVQEELIGKPITSQAEALTLCQHCNGKAHGDCSPECSCWPLTASPGQLEQAQRGPGMVASRARHYHTLPRGRQAYKFVENSSRRWEGPRAKTHDDKQ